jgi:hypothetical protein
MKLLMCRKCNDVISLIKEERSCYCGEVIGAYCKDGLNAWYTGEARPLGINNKSLLESIYKQDIEEKYWEEDGGNKDTCCNGIEFTAFCIPKWSNTLKKIIK